MATPALQSTPNLASDPKLHLEAEVVEMTEDLYEEIQRDKDREKEIKETQRILGYLEGKQWPENARYARSRPVINKFQRHFLESVGLLTDLALEFHVKLFDKISDFSDLESVLNQLATHWALRSQFGDSLYDVVLYGLLHSGYSKQQWNSTLAGGMGDVQVVPIAPWNIATIGASNKLQEAEVVCYYYPVTKAHLVRLYGDTAKRVESDPDLSGGVRGEFLRPAGVGKEQWAKLADPLKRIMGDRQETTGNAYPMVIKKEFWVKDDSKNESSKTITVGNPRANWSYLVEPGEPIYPRGRVIVTAGGCVMADDCNPYWHAQHPFAQYRPFRVPWKMSGVSVTKPWIQMNNIINRIWGGVLDMIASIIEPTLIAPKGAFPPADWDALDPGATGGKIKFSNNSPKPPEFAKRDRIPGEVLQYLQEIDKEYSMSSGASAVSQALGKKQVPGGDALEQIINSRSLPIKVESRALTSYVTDIGYQGVSNMLQFYSTQHRVAILGAKGMTAADFKPIYGEARPAGMKPEDFVRKFQFIIRPGQTLASEKSERLQIAFQLRKSGDLSSKGLFRELDQNFNFDRNRDELLEEAKIKLLVAGAAAAVSGKGQAGHKK